MNTIEYEIILEEQIELFNKDCDFLCSNYYLKNGITKSLDFDIFNLYTKEENRIVTQNAFLKELINKYLIRGFVTKILMKNKIEYIDSNSDNLLDGSIVDLIIYSNKTYAFYFDIGNFVMTNQSLQKWKSVNEKYFSEYYKVSFSKTKENNSNTISFQTFLDLVFSEIDSNKCILKIKNSIKEAKIKMGVNVLPTYDGKYIYIFKEQLIEKFEAKDIEYLPNQYYIYKPNIKNRNKTTCIDTANLLINEKIVNKFYEEKMYEALTTDSNFSKCFMTSEYLYQNFKGNGNLDYINIVAGYIKSIEILEALVKTHFLGKEKEDRNKTMGDIINDLKPNTKIIFKFEDYHNETIAIDCLFFYLNEIRNEFMHKIIVPTWEDVVKIRHNTLYVYILLLGGCNFNKTIKEELKMDNSSYSNLYKVILDNRRKIITLHYKNKSIRTILCKKNIEVYYDANGNVCNSYIELIDIKNKESISYDEYSDIEKSNEHIFISKSNLPDAVSIENEKRFRTNIWHK